MMAFNTKDFYVLNIIVVKEVINPADRKRDERDCEPAYVHNSFLQLF